MNAPDPLEHIREAYRDMRTHQHPPRDDLFCMNLSSFLGDRMGVVLQHYDDLAAQHRGCVTRDKMRAEIAAVVREVVDLATNHQADQDRYLEWVKLVRDVHDGVYTPPGERG